MPPDREMLDFILARLRGQERIARAHMPALIAQRLMASIAMQRRLVEAETGHRAIGPYGLPCLEYGYDNQEMFIRVNQQTYLRGEEAEAWMTRHTGEITDTAVLRELAYQYRDHPRYDERWKPHDLH